MSEASRRKVLRRCPCCVCALCSPVLVHLHLDSGSAAHTEPSAAACAQWCFGAAQCVAWTWDASAGVNRCYQSQRSSRLSRPRGLVLQQRSWVENSKRGGCCCRGSSLVHACSVRVQRSHHARRALYAHRARTVLCTLPSLHECRGSSAKRSAVAPRLRSLHAAQSQFDAGGE